MAQALMIGGSIIQGVSAIQQGQAQAKAARVQGEEQQQENEIAAQNTKITAQQQQAARLDDLSRTIGSMRATVASRNLDLNSPSAMALQGAADTYAQRDVSRLGFNSVQTQANYRLAGEAAVANAKAYGSIAKAAGWSKGISSFMQAASQAQSAFSKPAKAGA